MYINIAKGLAALACFCVAIKLKTHISGEVFEMRQKAEARWRKEDAEGRNE